MIENTLTDISVNPVNPVSIVSEDLLRAFYRLFYLQFRDSDISEKTLCNNSFTRKLRDIFT